MQQWGLKEGRPGNFRWVSKIQWELKNQSWSASSTASTTACSSGCPSPSNVARRRPVSCATHLLGLWRAPSIALPNTQIPQALCALKPGTEASMAAPRGALLQNRSKTPLPVHAAGGAEQHPGNRGHFSSSCHSVQTGRGTWPRTSPWECDYPKSLGPCDHLGHLKNLLGQTHHWSSPFLNCMGVEEQWSHPPVGAWKNSNQFQICWQLPWCQVEMWPCKGLDQLL